MPTLILTPRFTEDAQAPRRAAIGLGWAVERLRSWRVPEALRGVEEPVLYLEALFGPSLAPAFGLQLIEPPLDWLPALPERWRGRAVRLSTLGEARELTEPAFIKPPNDKSFAARGHETGATLPEGDGAEPVLIAEVVRWRSEFRCFVLDRELRTHSIYLRDGELQREQGYRASEAERAEAAGFVRELLADPAVPLGRTAVLDVGVIEGRGWAVVEQNAAWGAGIYGCDPTEVLAVLRHAAHTLGAAGQPS